MTLERMPMGDTAVVERVKGCGERSRRLLELGFTSGAEVKKLFAAASGEPVAYLVRGTVIALRHGDAALIQVRGI